MNTLSKWLAPLAFIFLVGCTTTNDIPVAGETPQQKMFAIDGGHKAILQLAVAYRDTCFAREEELQTNCRKVVEVLRQADREFTALREAAGSGTNIEILQASLARFQQLLITHAIRESIQQ